MRWCLIALILGLLLLVLTLGLYALVPGGNSFPQQRQKAFVFVLRVTVSRQLIPLCLIIIFSFVLQTVSRSGTYRFNLAA